VIGKTISKNATLYAKNNEEQKFQALITTEECRNPLIIPQKLLYKFELTEILPKITVHSFFLILARNYEKKRMNSDSRPCFKQKKV